MKSILLIILLAASAFAQEVKVTQQGNVTVDGVDKGTVVKNAKDKDVNPSVLQTAIVAALTEQVNAAKPLQDLFTKAQAALAVEDDPDPAKTLAALKLILTPAVDDAKLSEIQREIKKLQQVIADAQKRIEELNAQALKAKAAPPKPALRPAPVALPKKK